MLLGNNLVLTSEGLTPVEKLHTDQRDEFIVSKLGLMPTVTYTVRASNSSKSPKTWTFKLPRPCRVPIISGAAEDTYDLRPGDTLLPLTEDQGYDAASWASGFMFHHSIRSPVNLDPARYGLWADRLASILAADTHFTTPIDIPKDGTPKQKGSFIKGLLAADANTSPYRTGNRDLQDWFVSNAIYAGLVLPGLPNEYRRFIKANGNTVFYTETQTAWSKGTQFSGFKVLELEESDDAIAYSVEADGPHLVIDGGWKVYSD
jgi:hypothetical protein